jgi:hypothetical protein
LIGGATAGDGAQTRAGSWRALTDRAPTGADAEIAPDAAVDADRDAALFPREQAMVKAAGTVSGGGVSFAVLQPLLVLAPRTKAPTMVMGFSAEAAVARQLGSGS